MPIYKVKYTKKIGGTGHVNVKAKNAKAALSAAKSVRFTGKKHKVLGKVNEPKTPGLRGSI